ncbi:MAG: helix-turn-helix domain-containing protein [Actinomycetota bacterium]|nr:helix-turn-helix domain-containing protein [Actinomycetota bacterium]MDP9485270.1 helix-turn-helix domain-containing protein [Actinomycetota bacterium]
MGSNGRTRRRVEPTEDWQQIELLCGWPEQRDYELIRPLVLFGSPAAGRASETGTASERTLQRKASRFDAEGMESLFGSEHARRRRRNLPPALRRRIVDLKAEHPGFNLNEIANAVYVRFGRRPDHKTIRRVLAEEPVPLRFVRRYPPYHEISERRERRAAVVALHADGWSAKAIARYLRVGKSTVYRVLKRWVEEGPEGLEDGPHGRPTGVRKVTLKAIEAVRRFQQNPNLGEFRIHAALAQIGIHLSPRTCGRILAMNRELYDMEKPKGPVKEKREMPLAARRRHQFWTSDIRYIDDHGLGGRAYVVSVMDNHSRCILASALTRTQDLASYLSVLYAAVERYGSPEKIVTDGGGVFRARQARPSTRLWASASTRSSAAARGSRTSRRPSTSSAGWPTGPSRKRRAGPISWRHTTASSRTTTSSPTGPTASGKTAVARPRRFWPSPRGSGTARKS